MDARRYDLVVIGSGPAGHHAAIQGAKLGKSVAVVEQRSSLGGVALNAGTIPSKTLREAILYLTGFRQRGLYGASYRVKDKITLSDLRAQVDRVVNQETDVFRLHFLRNNVEVLYGTASFVDPGTIHIASGAHSYDVGGEKIVIAVGTRPARPGHIPFDGDRIVDTDQLWNMKHSEFPKNVIVVGGGVIGIEYACAAAALGTKVTLVEKRARILDFVDAEIVEALSYHMRAMDVVFRLGEEVTAVSKDQAGRVTALLASNKSITADGLLYAAGRVGNTDALNLAAIGLNTDARGRILVDANYRTEVPSIYAAGDVIGFPSLASTSMEQGRLATCCAFGASRQSMPEMFPYGIYTIPEISYVDRNEDQLTKSAIPYEVGVAHYREIARGQIIGDSHGFLKLLFHQQTRKLLGVHIIGEGATELVHIGQMVLTHNGTIDTFVDSVFNYPTLAECYKVAALAGINRLTT